MVDDARVTCRDGVFAVGINHRFAIGILLHRVEHTVCAVDIDEGTIEVDDHIALHVTTLIAATINAGTMEATAQVAGRRFS